MLKTSVKMLIHTKHGNKLKQVILVFSKSNIPIKVQIFYKNKNNTHTHTNNTKNWHKKLDAKKKEKQKKKKKQIHKNNRQTTQKKIERQKIVFENI